MTIFLPGMSVQKIEFVFLQKTIGEKDRGWSILSEPKMSDLYATYFSLRKK